MTWVIRGAVAVLACSATLSAEMITVSFGRVEYTEPSDGRTHDVQIVLDMEAGELRVAQEGGYAFVRLPFYAVTGLTYEPETYWRPYSAWGRTPTRHWLLVEFVEQVPHHQVGEVRLRLHKGNYEDIVRAVDAAVPDVSLRRLEAADRWWR